MPVSAKSLDDGKKVEINVQGRFDFNDHSAFRETYKTESPAAEYVIDMDRAEYLDSSALGMLLLLREHAGADKAKIQIINTPNEIMKIFKISNFDSLFNIS
ncbi:MAG: STAS domain-containing protein [Thioalkalispiraceae bacterium]|jgi:anti-anti-sigma factor